MSSRKRSSSTSESKVKKMSGMEKPYMKAEVKEKLCKLVERYVEDKEINIECTQCRKWRRVAGYSTGDDVPDFWECSMQEDGNCYIPSSCVDDNDFMEFDPGQVVWAKTRGFPWWPGMIDYCKTLQYFKQNKKSEKYYVKLFGERVHQEWIDKLKVCAFSKYSADEKVGKERNKYPGLERAILQAEKAQKMKIKDRLRKYSIGAVKKYSDDLCTVSFCEGSTKDNCNNGASPSTSKEDKIRKGCENSTPASTSKDNSKYFFCSEDMRNSYKNGTSANITSDWDDVVGENMKRKRRKDSSTYKSLLLEGRALHEAIEEIRRNVLPSTQKVETYIILPNETPPVIDTNESSSNEGTIIYENEESNPDSEQFIKNSPLLHKSFDDEFFSPS